MRRCVALFISIAVSGFIFSDTPWLGFLVFIALSYMFYLDNKTVVAMKELEVAMREMRIETEKLKEWLK